MSWPKTSTLTLLGSLLLTLAACTTQPQSATTPAPTTTPSTPTSTPTPTPTPTREALGPEGTVISKDGKIWLVCKDGNYTIDVPENYEPTTFNGEERKKTILESTVRAGTGAHFTPRLDLRKVPTKDETIKNLSAAVVLPWEMRDDLTDFAGNPATTVHFHKIDTSDEPDPNYDGTLLSVTTDIGDTRWIFDFDGNNPKEAEDLFHNTASTLKKQ
ncbi:hypothetical protein [Buchananella hordeovulneris]|uniref:hypothetical protein n=1 Tax=Buchananella hordeovulneris TaxID=52770 RepID=UPI00163A686D|nr:hypothetical protein [Buchananella hordeovulneris]